jgi:hypothetical protein
MKDEGRSNRRTDLVLLILPRPPAFACAKLFPLKSISFDGDIDNSRRRAALY